MKILINLRSDIPIYIQIVEQTRQQVANGALKPGDQLPTVRALAADLRVNFNTVARAYRMLDEAHERRRQRGLAQQVKLLHDGRAAEAERYRRVQRHVGDHVLVHEARPAHGLRYCDDELHG